MSMSESEGLDLSGTVYSASEIFEPVVPGSDKKTGWRIELAGPSHPKTVALSEDVTRERLNREKAVEFAQVNGRKWKPDDETPDERAKRTVTRLVKRIVGWSPNPLFKFFSPEPIQFSEEKAVELFLRPEMGGYLGQLADRFMSEAAFTQGSAKN